MNRGREILHRVTDPPLDGNSTHVQIQQYAERLLKELSSVEYTISYAHGYCPVRLGDCVRFNYKRAGLTDIKAKVINQSIDCSAGCQVSETAVFTKKLWRLVALSNELISQFVEVTADTAEKQTESTVYGKIVVQDNTKYVQIDGSDLLTPISSTADVQNGERVTVLIKDHKAVVSGNITSPSASSTTVTEISNKVAQAETLIAEKVSTKDFETEKARIDTLVADNVTIKDRLTAGEASISNLEAEDATINGKLIAQEADITELKTKKLDAEYASATYATIENLNATNADVHNLNADYGEFKELATGKFTAQQASIDDLEAKKLSVESADAKYATIENLNATNADITNLESEFGSFKTLTTDNFTAVNADIDNLEANKLSATEADLKYANIDFSNIGKAAFEYFYATSGLIQNVTVGDATITGKLVGVTISGDLIEGNTIVADKLVIKGEDGLYYQLNTNGMTVEAEQTDYNSLNGSVIQAKSVTAEKIRVEDLVAFGATIAGFTINDSSLYSGVKESATNTTRGIFLGKDGQMAVGDETNFIKFFKDTDGSFKLNISASSMMFGASQRNVEEEIDDAKSTADSADSKADESLTRMSTAELNIDAINGAISSLVTDQNGQSLMTQTSNGWTFNISAIQNALNQATSDIADLTDGEAATNAELANLKDNVDNLGVYTDYIEFGTDNGKPCITLGERDSEFKVLITNTDIRFMEGSTIPANISNQSLNIKKAVISEELKQGGFVWMARENGNYGLLWKGV